MIPVTGNGIEIVYIEIPEAFCILSPKCDVVEFHFLNKSEFNDLMNGKGIARH